MYAELGLALALSHAVMFVLSMSTIGRLDHPSPGCPVTVAPWGPAMTAVMRSTFRSKS